MKTHCLSGKEQSKIVGIHKASAKGVKIATKLDHLKTTVYIVIKRFESHGIMEGKKSTNSGQKMLKRTCRVVMYALVANKRQIVVDITNQSSYDESNWIVRKVLHEVGFYNKIA